jgi:syntaxin-binding protein 1
VAKLVGQLHYVIHLTVLLSQWKVCVLDPNSRQLLYNVLKEDDILNQNITRMCSHQYGNLLLGNIKADVEYIDQKRPMSRDVDVVYVLKPEPWVVDILMNDFERRRYRNTYLIWTSCMSGSYRTLEESLT